MNIFLVIILLITGGCFLDKNMQNNELPIIPLENFFKNPEKSSFQISPNGQFISYMKPWEEGNRRMNVYVKPFDSEEEIRITNAKKRSLYGYFWLNNNRIAYVQDKGGDENIHIYAVDIDGSNDIDLTPFENIQARITDDLEEDENFILIELNKNNPQVHDVYRLNVNNGDLELIAKNPGNISGWMTDNDGKLRIALTSDGVNSSILYRDNEKDDFQEILTTNFKESVSPLFFTFDNNEIYVSSNRHRDKSSIYKFDFQK